MQAEDVARELRSVLREALAADRVEVANVRRMTGGAVHETWAFDATVAPPGGPEERRRLVLRSYSPVAPQSMGARAEFTVLRAAHAAGVPAPQPLALLDQGLWQPGYVMERIDGETIGRRLVKDPTYARSREVITAQLGRILAAVHRIPLGGDIEAFLPGPPEGVPAAAHEVDRLEATYRGVTPDLHPAFELALRWLRRHLVPAPERVFVHGDYRVGNVIFGPEGVRAVLDWEGAHVGDPAEDLGWLCVRSWRFGGDRPVGGVGSREDLIAAYHEGGGCPVDAERVRWWVVFGNVRWGVATLRLVQPFLDGRTPDLEPASIGRRTTETEGELMELIDGG